MVLPPPPGAHPGAQPSSGPGDPGGSWPGSSGPRSFGPQSFGPRSHGPSPSGPGGSAQLPAATRWVWCGIGGLLAVAVAVLTGWLFLGVPRFRLADQAALLGARAEGWSDSLDQSWARAVLGVVSEPFLVAALAVAVVVALVRRRWGDAIRAMLIVAGANLTTQVLKELLERPVDVGVPDSSYGNSLPSGHATVAASVAAVALVVAPRATRPVVALVGAAYAATTAVATMLLSWHRPSDLLAAFAIVSAWSLLVLVPTRGRPADGHPGTAGRVLTGWLLGLVAVVGIAVGLVTLAISVATVGGDLTGTSAVLTAGAMRLAYLGAACGIAGVAALASLTLLLARR